MSADPYLVYSTDLVNVVRCNEQYLLVLKRHGKLDGVKALKNKTFYSTEDWLQALYHAYEYENTNELLWLTADINVYIQWLEKQLSVEQRKVYVIGKSNFAKDVSSNLDKIGILHNFTPRLDNKALSNNLILIFCDDFEVGKNDLVNIVGHLRHVSVVAKKTDRHFSKKTLFLIAPPKAGTHLLFQLAEALGYKDGNWREKNDYPGGEWRFLRRHNAHTSTKSFFVDMVDEERFGNRLHPFNYSPAIFMYRHVVDVLLSEAEYYHRSGVSVFSGVMRGQGSTTARMKYLLSESCILGSFVNRLKEFSSWFDCPNVIPISYEAMVGNRGGASSEITLHTIWKTMLLLEVDGSVAKIASKLYNKNSPTLNKAICFRSTEMNLSDFASSEELQDLAKLNKTFGYSADITEKQLSLKPFEDHVFAFESKSAHDPVLILSSFFGHNIVLYQGTYFGVPSSKGAFIPDKEHDVTLMSKSLEEIKLLIYANTIKNQND
jgi:hypothetical protein